MSVSTDANSHVYLAGLFSSPQLIVGIDTLTNVTNTATCDLFSVKYDADGNVLWAKSVGGTGQDYTWSSTTDAAGNFYLTGEFDSPTLTFGSYTLNSVGAGNIFLAKYDSSGNVDWAKSQTQGVGRSRCVASNSCGNILLVGTLISPAIIFDTILLTPDTLNLDNMFIVEYNSSGNAIWGTDLLFGGDDGIGIATDASDNVYFGGDIYPPIAILGNDTLINIEEETPFVAKLHFKCSVDIPEIHQKDFAIQISPNPFTIHLQIQYTITQPAELIVYDALGRKVRSYTLLSSQKIIELSLAELPAGVYLVAINSGGQSFSEKVVKE